MKKKILISILVIVVIVAAVFGYYIYRMWPMLSTTMGDVELTEDHQSHRITEETTSKGSETEMTDRADESKQVSGGTDYTLTTKVVDVINDPVFGDYGRLIFRRTKDSGISYNTAGGFAHLASIVGCYSVAGGILAGGCSGVGGGSVIESAGRLPVHICQGEGAAAVLD